MDAARQLAQLAERERELLLGGGRAARPPGRGPCARLPWASRRSARARRAAAGRRRAGCAPAGGAPACRPRRSARATSRSSSTRARSWACRRSFSIARPAAAATERSSSGSSHSVDVVHDRADAAALELDRRPGARGVAVRRQLDGVALGVDPAALVVEPERRAGASGRRARRPAGSAACRCRAPRRAAAAAPRPRRRARRGCARGRSGTPTGPRRRRSGRASPSTSVSRETPAASEPERGGQQDQHRDARPQHRRQRAPLRRRGGAPAAQQDHEHDRDDRDADHRRDRVEDVAQRVVAARSAAPTPGSRRTRMLGLKPHSSCGSGPTSAST